MSPYNTDYLYIKGSAFSKAINFKISGVQSWLPGVFTCNIQTGDVFFNNESFPIESWSAPCCFNLGFNSNVMIPKVSCVPLSLVPYLFDICGSITRKKHHSICPFKFVVPFHIQWSPSAPSRTCRMPLGRWCSTIPSGPRQKAQGAEGPGTKSARSQGRFQWWCWSKTESHTTSCTQGRWREGAIA